MARRFRLVAGLVALAALLGGCSTTASDLPLPGTSMPGETFRVTATFDDALNLAEGAPVKINGVPVGRVAGLSVENLRAVVTMDISAGTEISTSADFRLRATTALGELFVDVVEDPTNAPAGASTAVLADGDEVGADRSSAAPTVEDTLAAASLFINGGGLGQLQTIVDEANLVIGGREDTLRDLLQRVGTTAESLTAMSGDIDAALAAISDASQVLADRQSTIDRALTELAPAAAVLEANTTALVDLLTSVDQLGGVVVPTIAQTRDDIATIVAQAGPLFAEVASVGPRLQPGIAEVVALAAGLEVGVPTNYLNLRVVFTGALNIGGLSLGPLGAGLPGAGPTGTAPTPAPETAPAAPGSTPDLSQLPFLGNLTGLLQPSSATGGGS